MASKKTALTLDTLSKIDGGQLVKQFDACLLEAVADMQRRPRQKKPRKVGLTFTLKPNVTGEGPDAELDTVEVEFEVTNKRPALKPKTYKMLPHKDGKLSFSPDEPDDPLATHLPFEDDK